MKTKLIFTDKQREVRKRIVEQNRENKRKLMDQSRDDSVLNSTTSPPPDNHYKCYLGNNCKLDVKGRNSCKKCRLDKCFAVGMKTDSFQTDEQNRLRKSIIENNRKRKLSNTSSITTNSSGDGVYSDTSSPLRSPPLSPLQLDCVDTICIDDSFTDISTDNHFEDIITCNPIVNNLELQSIVPIMRPITDYNNQFNELEGNRLSELLEATKLISLPTLSATANANYIFINDPLEAMNVMIAKNDPHIRCIINM
ncbi:unnamed protein product, partial [Oppiella nova]